jgi:hypothetical protein
VNGQETYTHTSTASERLTLEGLARTVRGMERSAEGAVVRFVAHPDDVPAVSALVRCAWEKLAAERGGPDLLGCPRVDEHRFLPRGIAAGLGRDDHFVRIIRLEG